MTTQHQRTRQHTKRSATHLIARVATADARGFPFRKVGALLCLTASLAIIVVHETIHHGDDHEIGWATWFLFAVGATDLGLQLAGVAIKKFILKE